jgi:hypothetical protein
MSSVGTRPNQTFEFNIIGRGSWGRPLNGLPPHLQVLNDRGQPTHSLRNQFSKTRVSKKKRGRL